MRPRPGLTSNFAHLQAHDEQLLRLGMLAERYFAEDPNTCLLKLRQLAELLAQITASNVGILDRPEDGQYELLLRLRDHGILPAEIFQLFGEVRRTGNAANHSLTGDHRTALATLKIVWQLGVWFHRTFAKPDFKSGPFIPPQPPADESAELRAELESLSAALAEHQAAHDENSRQLESLEAALRAAKDEQSFWETIAAESEAEKNAFAARLAAKQAETVAQPRKTAAALVKASTKAASHLHLDEAATRRLIDEQLRQAGWLADSDNLRYSKGARPEKGKNMAIAEWPTESGPADYVLFCGLTPMAPVEAKRKHLDVSSSLQQAKRYSRGFKPSADLQTHSQSWGAKGEFRLPFVFSTNGRPYLRQIDTHSGIWFCDLRRPENLSRALQGWFTPEGLAALLKQDEDAAHAQLATEGFDYGFDVRFYQEKAILKTEGGIIRGLRDLLIAMATGTGKTKTCIALIYRLLKTKRFRRILFRVDRSALGEQAANAFKDTRMENLNTFAEVFGIKEIDEQKPDSDTSVHIATIQGMVQRVLFPSENNPPPAIDQYDCINDPPIRIETELSKKGIVWKKVDKVKTYKPDTSEVALATAPDEIKIEVEQFNKKVITKSFNRVVCDFLANEIDPASPQKNPHLLRQRRPRRSSRGPVEKCLRETIRLRRGRRRHQDHRYRRQAALAHPPLQERVPAERRRHRGPPHHRH